MQSYQGKNSKTELGITQYRYTDEEFDKIKNSRYVQFFYHISESGNKLEVTVKFHSTKLCQKLINTIVEGFKKYFKLKRIRDINQPVQIESEYRVFLCEWFDDLDIFMIYRYFHQYRQSVDEVNITYPLSRVWSTWKNIQSSVNIPFVFCLSIIARVKFPSIQITTYKPIEKFFHTIVDLLEKKFQILHQQIDGRVHATFIIKSCQSSIVKDIFEIFHLYQYIQFVYVHLPAQPFEKTLDEIK